MMIGVVSTWNNGGGILVFVGGLVLIHARDRLKNLGKLRVGV